VLVPSNFKLQTAEVPMPISAKPSIVDIALGDPNFSMLVMLLQKADLVGALQQEGPYTVFAPTNEAFTKLLAALDITPDELMAQPDLAKVLLYHVVSGKVLSKDLSDGQKAATLNGNSIEVDLTNGVKINSSSVIQADIEASNGVIHVIDSILVPADFTLQSVDLTATSVPDTGLPNVLPMIVSLGAGSMVLAVSLKKGKKQ
jgi:transforming growth factor-beta-induced protein